ncbi:MAG: HAD family hydrolase [Thermoplasmata archaeon]|nr:HAD family hydrolase [Thermoplasmata archaeon]
MDRDGVINENRRDYVKTPDELVFLPNAAEAIRRINQAGWLVVIITNQSMIGRGIATEEAFQTIMDKLASTLKREGALIDGVYHCPHVPESDHPWRKPNPGMLLQAAEDMDIDLSASVMVGDLPGDIEAGRRAGTMRQELVDDTRSLLDVVTEILGSGE